MWDYKIGLVRTTPFFKSLGYVKVCLLSFIASCPLPRLTNLDGLVENARHESWAEGHHP